MTIERLRASLSDRDTIEPTLRAGSATKLRRSSAVSRIIYQLLDR